MIVGTAAGRVSARRGLYYAGNRFWRTLHEVGLTPIELRPGEHGKLLDYGIGLTDLAKGDAIPACLRCGRDAAGMAPGPDGNLGFAEGDGVARITPSGQVTEFLHRVSGSTPYGIASEFLEPIIERVAVPRRIADGLRRIAANIVQLRLRNARMLLRFPI